MTGVTLHVTGLDALLRLTQIDVRKSIRSALYAVGELVRNEIARAPGPAKKPIAWASEKQRRYVMALVRQHGPWVRESHSLSQRLIASWTVRHEGDDVVVGNRTTYGPWVQSAEYQQPMHSATGWRTDQTAVDIVSRSGDIERVLGQALEHALRSG